VVGFRQPYSLVIRVVVVAQFGHLDTDICHAGVIKQGTCRLCSRFAVSISWYAVAGHDCVYPDTRTDEQGKKQGDEDEDMHDVDNALSTNLACCWSLIEALRRVPGTMPHLYVEFSANTEAILDVDGLLDKLYDTALASGVFPLGGIRVRAQRIDNYRIADCAPENAYIHVTALLGFGRPLDIRRRVGEALFAALGEHCSEAFEHHPLALSLTLQELHPELNFKKNNLHDYVRQRRDEASG
jgi:5-carboxymethyl-2-hydroxymuconate isomerase